MILHPPILNRLVALWASACCAGSRSSTTSAGGPSRGAAAASAVAWFLIGMHLWVLAVALDAPPGQALLAAGFGYALAASIGLLVVFTPAGLGARDVVVVLALSSVMPRSAATAAAIVSRFVVLVADLIAAAFGWLVERGERA